MRITCPSCASHFELPSELLGKKGRALKCATCQHSWYQAAQVESLDLASVMGEDYAAQAANGQAASAQAGAQAVRPQQQQAQQRAQQQRAAQGGIQRIPQAQAAAAQNARNLLANALGAVEGQRGGVQAGALGAPRESGRNVQAAPLRQQQPHPNAQMPGSPPVPAGAVSMMSRRNQFQQRPNPGAPPTTAQSWFAGTARAAGAPQQQQPGAQGAPGAQPQAAAVLAGPAPRGGQPSPNAPGQGAVSWMQQPGGQQQMPAGAPISMAGAHAGPGAAPLPGQSMRGQAGSAPAPGQAAVSWMNPQGQIVPPGTPGAVPAPIPGMPPGMPPGMQGGPMGAAGGPGQLPPGAMPGMPQGAMGAMGGPGANAMAAALGAPNSPAQAQAAALPGQSMRGQAGAAAAPGQAAVSWMQQPGAHQQMPQVAPLGMAGTHAAPGAPPLPGQSMRGQAAQGAPGEAAVSWMKPGAQGAPGAPGQSMMDRGLPAGPGAAAVSQLSNEIIAPGQGAHSLLDGSQVAPGAPGQSMLDHAGASGGPGVAAAPAAAAGAQPGQSMMDAGASGGPGAGPQAAAATAAAAGEDARAPGEAGASGGPGAGPGGKKAEAELVAGAAGGPKAAGELKTDPAKKKDPGASGGPGAKSAAAEAAAPGADEEEELVDPDADRPNFGSSADEEAAEDAEEDAGDGFAQVASRAGGGRGGPATPVKIRKPLDPAYTTAIMMAGFVGIIVATLWFARAELAKLVPQIQALYDKVGVEAPKPGDGLSIAESSKRLQRIGGIETLVVRGYVANIGDIPRTVPGVRLELYNEKREVIQAEAANAPAAILDPAASAEFEIRMKLPQLSQAKGGYAVVWDIPE
ncbi:MAG: DUF3426 domain-containing protein [Rhodospirillaceae bacterium]